MLRYMIALIAAMSATTVHAQDFNFTPGWANTYNFNRLNSGSGEASEPQELELCRFDMLPTSEQQRLHENALALIAEHGEKEAAPLLEQQSLDAIEQMVEDGLCRSE